MGTRHPGRRPLGKHAFVKFHVSIRGLRTKRHGRPGVFFFSTPTTIAAAVTNHSPITAKKLLSSSFVSMLHFSEFFPWTIGRSRGTGLIVDNSENVWVRRHTVRGEHCSSIYLSRFWERVLCRAALGKRYVPGRFPGCRLGAKRLGMWGIVYLSPGFRMGANFSWRMFHSQTFGLGWYLSSYPLMRYIFLTDIQRSATV